MSSRREEEPEAVKESITKGGERQQEETTERKEVKEELEAEKEEGIEVVEERFFTVPFRKVWIAPRGKRTPRAVRILKEFVRRNMKVENVRLSNEVNEVIWSRGIKKPPRRLRIRAVKDKEGTVFVYPAEAA
jgi:large subunit ribosomal protein L31e